LFIVLMAWANELLTLGEAFLDSVIFRQSSSGIQGNYADAKKQRTLLVPVACWIFVQTFLLFHSEEFNGFHTIGGD
jgi:hypothetical protein